MVNDTRSPAAVLAGRAALVTGASGGIGRAIAVALGMCGAQLCVVGRDEARLTVTADEIRARGGQVVQVIADATRPRQIDDLVARVDRDFSFLNILVHAAGHYRRALMAESTTEDLDDHYRTNIRAPYQLTQAMLPALSRQGGDVVFINSTQGLSAGAGLSQYSATQHAVKAVADSLRAEINNDCVRVTTIHLGRTATSLQETIFAIEGRSYRPERLIQPEDVADVVVAAVTLPRRAQVTSVTLWPTEKV